MYCEELNSAVVSQMVLPWLDRGSCLVADFDSMCKWVFIYLFIVYLATLAIEQINFTYYS
jgi:hypothetical protein